MQFSLRVICNCRIVETVNQRVETLTNYLSLSYDYAFSPYWKDNECVILELNAKIENINYSEIQRFIQLISGAENLSKSCLTGEWECEYYASLDELHSNNNTAFVVCNIFEEQKE